MGPKASLNILEKRKNLLPLLGFESQAYTYVPCCFYIVKIFRSLHVKWLAKVLLYDNPRDVHFLDFTLSLFYINLRWFIEKFKIGVLQYMQDGQDDALSVRQQKHVWNRKIILHCTFLLIYSTSVIFLTLDLDNP